MQGFEKHFSEHSVDEPPSSVEKRIYCLLLRIYVTSIRQQVTGTWCRSYEYSNPEPKSTKYCQYLAYKSVYNYIPHSAPSLTKVILQNQRANNRNRKFSKMYLSQTERIYQNTNINPLHNYTVQQTVKDD
jgi:hypothetical protein